MTSPPPARLGFEAWARLSAAQIERAPAERTAILERAEIDPQAYRAADAHWNEVLAADLAAGMNKRAERYAALCEEALAERRRAAAEAEAAARAAAKPPAPAEPPPAAKVEVEVPSFLRETAEVAAGFSTPLAVPLPIAVPVHEPSKPPPPPAGGTADVSSILAAGGPALPFADKRSAPPPPPEEPSAPAVHAPSGTTDVESILKGAVLPFPHASVARKTGPSAEVSVGGFTLHQYASLCAELAVYSDKTAQVLGRYGLPNEAARRSLAKLWEQRLVGDDDLCRTWAELSAQYREWLARQPKR